MTRQEARYTLSGAAFKIYDAICESPGRISLKQFATLTGLSDPTICLAIQECLKKEAITRTPEYHYAIALEVDKPPTKKILEVDKLPTKKILVDKHHTPISNHLENLSGNLSNPYNKNLNIFDVQKQKISRTHEEHIFKWRTNVRKLAEYSCIVLKDQRSLGFHISVWAKARKHNLIDEVCQIMTDLEKQSMQTGKPQGALFNKMTRLLFESRGIIETRHADDKERAEAKAALAHFAAEN